MLLPFFMINEYFSTSTVGYFDLSRQILAVPIAFITASLSQVLLKDFSDRLRKKNPLTKSVLKTSLLLTLGIIPFVIAIVFWGKELFSFFFSDTWEQSGIYSAILVPAFAIQFIVSPLSISFTVLEKLKTLAIWQILYFVAILSLRYFKDLSIENFLLLYTIINLSAYLIYYILIISICRKYDKSL
jgi:O-antigen/teichoic acid export membrane protein